MHAELHFSNIGEPFKTLTVFRILLNAADKSLTMLI